MDDIRRRYDPKERLITELRERQKFYKELDREEFYRQLDGTTHKIIKRIVSNIENVIRYIEKSDYSTIKELLTEMERGYFYD